MPSSREPRSRSYESRKQHIGTQVICRPWSHNDDGDDDDEEEEEEDSNYAGEGADADDFNIVARIVTGPGE